MGPHFATFCCPKKQVRDRLWEILPVLGVLVLQDMIDHPCLADLFQHVVVYLAMFYDWLYQHFQDWDWSLIYLVYMYIWICLSCFGVFCYFVPWQITMKNHHLGECVFLFPSIFSSKSKLKMRSFQQVMLFLPRRLSGNFSPPKINSSNLKSWWFGSDDFPFWGARVLRFQPFIFRGVCFFFPTSLLPLLQSWQR